MKETNDIQFPYTNPVTPNRLERLREIAGRGPVLILTHDNPDPDGLASGDALSLLLREAWNIPSRLVYSGLVARAENKAMLRLLTPEWKHQDTLDDLDQYSAIALVDTQPGAGNNRVPQDVKISIILDHHFPLRENLEFIPFVDVRPEAGATVSLVFQYLEAMQIEPDRDLATAIFYGIQTDTRGLSRDSSAIDQHVYFKLLARLDRKKLSQVEQAGLPREYFQALSKGFLATRVYQHVVVTYQGEMHRPDFNAEMADILIRLEGIKIVLCMGYHQNTMYLSMRASADDLDAGRMIQDVAPAQGKAGGHGKSAGGQIPLGSQSAELVAAEIESRFLHLMGETGDWKPLLL